jgi:alpha-ribazole phosphatase
MLVLLTHGQTQSELDKVFLGRGDSPFTDEGLEQMQDAAGTLSTYQFDHIYASDLYTAQEMLKAVLQASTHKTPWTLVEELRERSAGSYEGRKYSDIRKGMSPKQYKAWERDPFEPPLHGESIVDVQDRIKDWFNPILTQLKDNKNILIISHPDAIKALITLSRGDDLVDVMGVKIEMGMPYFYYGLTG